MLETTTQTGATRTIFELEDNFQDREYKNCATAGNEMAFAISRSGAAFAAEGCITKTVVEEITGAEKRFKKRSASQNFELH